MEILRRCEERRYMKKAISRYFKIDDNNIIVMKLNQIDGMMEF